MEYLDGAIYWDLLLEKLEPDDRRKIYVNKNKVISALHTVNFDDVGLQIMENQEIMLQDRYQGGLNNILHRKQRILNQ